LPVQASIWAWAGVHRRVPAASVLEATAEERALETALVLFEPCPQAVAVIVNRTAAASNSRSAVRVIVPRCTGRWSGPLSNTGAAQRFRPVEKIDRLRIILSDIRSLGT
jgi:hypothetical protein